MANPWTNEQIAVLRQAQMAANALIPGHDVPGGNADCPACRLSAAIEDFIRAVREQEKGGGRREERHGAEARRLALRERDRRNMSGPPPDCPVCGGQREWAGERRAVCHFCGREGAV